MNGQPPDAGAFDAHVQDEERDWIRREIERLDAERRERFERPILEAASAVPKVEEFVQEAWALVDAHRSNLLAAGGEPSREERGAWLARTARHATALRDQIQTDTLGLFVGNSRVWAQVARHLPPREDTPKSERGVLALFQRLDRDLADLAAASRGALADRGSAGRKPDHLKRGFIMAIAVAYRRAGGCVSTTPNGPFARVVSHLFAEAGDSPPADYRSLARIVRDM